MTQLAPQNTVAISYTAATGDMATRDSAPQIEVAK